jgi:hypothetical protein
MRYVWECGDDRSTTVARIVVVALIILPIRLEQQEIIPQLICVNIII